MPSEECKKKAAAVAGGTGVTLVVVGAITMAVVGSIATLGVGSPAFIAAAAAVIAGVVTFGASRVAHTAAGPSESDIEEFNAEFDQVVEEAVREAIAAGADPANEDRMRADLRRMRVSHVR